ncbi:phosphate signaling complex protein PhoU [Alkalicoccus chagannorensis]|uniref:phosphate signaling complex protein PhoU n=1 Tax=Alkalicoccus chagannorensis TaxID=427072 RepID=UPI0004202DB7|nr:phosphate signaling complex protein PhoU [Alkalicoccus chagannorensis]
MMRQAFFTEMEDLKKDLLDLGTMAASSFQRVYQAASKGDSALLKDIIEEDAELNKAEMEINEKATLIMTKQQPVAKDLRHVIVCLKISSDLERIGDLSVDMAKAYLHLRHHEAFAVFESDFHYLFDHVSAMLDDVLESYKLQDPLKAQQIAAMDDEVDRVFGKLIKEMFQSEMHPDETIQLAFTARYMERIGDYCTNIAEWVLYEVNGRRFDLN